MTEQLTYFDCQFHIGHDIYLGDVYFGTILGVDRRNDGRLLLDNGDFPFEVPLLPTMKLKLRPFDSITDDELKMVGKIFDNSIEWTVERTPANSEFVGALLKGSTKLDYLKVSFDTESISSFYNDNFYRLHSSIEKFIQKFLLIKGFDVFELEQRGLAFY